MPKESIDYHQLLHSLKTKRDVNALVDLYNASRLRLFGIAFIVLRNEEAAKDVVQEFFIDFWENDLFDRINGSLKSYLARSVWNRSLNYKKKHQPLIQLNIDLDVDAMPEHRHAIENEELGKEIESAINKLTPMVRKVFILHYVDRLSYAEIGRQLGIAKPTISNHIHKALTVLRQDLKKVYEN